MGVWDVTFRRIRGNAGLDDEIEARERAIRNLVEDRIQAAMEAGAFDELPGKGRPLELDVNPYVRPELRLAYKVLADANFAPDWIELDKAVRAAREELDSLQRRHIAWLRRQREAWTEAPNAGRRFKERHSRTRHERTRRELEKRVHELNRKIDELNLIVPQLSLQRPRLSVDNVLADFDVASREAYPELNENCSM